LINLLSELGSLGMDLFLYSDRPLHPDQLDRLAPLTYKVRLSGSMRYPVWEQYWLPRQCRADRIDILHSTHNFGLPWFSSCPRVLTLHDAIFHVHNPGFAGHFGDRWRHWTARRSANHIITVSEHSKTDLVDRLRIPPDRITVTHEASDPMFQRPVSTGARKRVRARYDLGRRYIFYTGGWESRKNVPFLLRAFAAASLASTDLVLAGQPDGDVRKNIETAVAELNIGDRVRLLGWVSDEVLPALYSDALCFVYPSRYEGFGLQLCEAMAAGCPVLAARATSLPEILGSGGETFSLDDPAELISLLRQIAGDGEFRQQLVRRAAARSATLHWRFTAERTIGVYEILLRHKLSRAITGNESNNHCESSCP
jgi:hypothetical protein